VRRNVQCESVLAAKEKHASLGATLPQAETRVWGVTPENEMLIGGCSQISSTLCWGSWHIYAGTASDGLVNRYYSNAYGRFMTPDPYQKTAISPSDPSSPQSWNRYAYVQGDPVNFSDPSGQDLGDTLGDNLWESGGTPPPWSWGPCGSDTVMTYVNGMQMPSPCDFLPIVPAFFAPQPKPAAPYLAGLELVGDCYDRSAGAFAQAGGAAVDDLTYQPVNQYGQPYYGPLTITEKNTVIQGNATSINTAWTISGGETFTDYISSGAGQSVFQENESYFLSGSSTPLNVSWFFGATYAVLGIYATPSAVIINNTVPVNKNGTPHYCDQPNSIQNR
jgi:RHS repeat-associated protein